MASEKIVKFSEWISGGWELYKQEWKTWSAMAAFLFVPAVIIIILAAIGIIALAAQRHPEGYVIVMMILILVLMMIGMLVYVSYVMGGMYKAAFKQIRGEKIETSDVWSGGFALGLKIAGANIVITMLVIAGAMLCYVPAFIVAGLVYFTVPLIVKKEMGISEALSRSYEITKKDWLMFTLFAFVAGMIAQIGTYACYIGIIFTLPLMYTISAVAFMDCYEGGYQPLTTKTLIGVSKYCASCGKPLPANANFCGNCGAGQNH